jgi:hypothetical protein
MPFGHTFVGVYSITELARPCGSVNAFERTWANELASEAMKLCWSPQLCPDSCSTIARKKFCAWLGGTCHCGILSIAQSAERRNVAEALAPAA